MMNYDIILVRYGELSLKSTYVRKYFESSLVRNIKKALTQENILHVITKERGRIYVSTGQKFTNKLFSFMKNFWHRFIQSSDHDAPGAPDEHGKDYFEVGIHGNCLNLERVLPMHRTIKKCGKEVSLPIRIL